MYFSVLKHSPTRSVLLNCAWETSWPLTEDSAVVTRRLTDALPRDEHSNIVMGAPLLVKGLLPGAKVYQRHVCVSGDFELGGEEIK